MLTRVRDAGNSNFCLTWQIKSAEVLELTKTLIFEMEQVSLVYCK